MAIQVCSPHRCLRLWEYNVSDKTKLPHQSETVSSFQKRRDIYGSTNSVYFYVTVYSGDVGIYHVLFWRLNDLVSISHHYVFWYTKCSTCFCFGQVWYYVAYSQNTGLLDLSCTHKFNFGSWNSVYMETRRNAIASFQFITHFGIMQYDYD